MAEGFGIVAGSVGIGGFAGQIAGGVIKLKSLYKAAKNADQEIETLADDIAIFATFLGQAEGPSSWSTVPKPSYLTQCYLHCRTLIFRLDLLIKKLEHDLKDRRLYGKVKYAFKRDEIKDLRDILTRAQLTLSLAHQSFANESNRNLSNDLLTELKAEIRTLRAEGATTASAEPQLERPPINEASSQVALRPQMTVHAETIETIQDYDVSTATWVRRGKYAHDEAPAAKSRFIFPFPWFGRRWAFETSKLHQRWDFSLRLYNVIPHDSLVFEYARRGDVAGLRVLFEAKIASPFDVDCKYGRTPLHVAARNDQPDAVQFLIDQGADVNAHTWNDNSCFEEYWGLRKRGSIYNEEEILPNSRSAVSETLRILVRESDLFYSRDRSIYASLVTNSIWNRYEDVLFVLKSIYPSYEDIPLHERIGVALCTVSYKLYKRDVLHPEALLSLCGLKQAQLNPTFWESIDVQGILASNLLRTKHNAHDLLPAWRNMLRMAISQLLECRPNSLAEYFLYCVTAQKYVWTRVDLMAWRDLNRRLHTWIEEFELAGIDPGKLSEILSEFLLYYPDRWERFKSGRNAYVKVRLINIIYGPNIEDWKIWTSWPLDEWAGEFWYWVENPEEFMPGSWIDEEELDRSYSYRYRGQYY